MNKRAFSTTLLVLLLLQTAQAQVTVRAIAPAGTGWQMDSTFTEVTPIAISTTSVSAPVTYEAPQLPVDPAVFGTASDCTSWQCSSQARTPSPTQQIQTIQQQIQITQPEDQITKSTIGIPSQLSYANKLMRNAHFGLAYRDTLCGVGVRTTFAKAGLFKPGPSGINSTAKWHPYLVKQGFKNMGKDSPYCKVPGVIRLYDKSRIKVKRRTKGDIYGHVEFVGTDGKFYAAAKSNTSRDTQLAPGRRTLIGCYVKTSEVE